jgi:hypothetical protein
MTSTAVWKMAITIGFLTGMTMISYGCDLNKPESEKDEHAESGRKRTSYNLEYVRCPGNPNSLVEVEVDEKGHIDPKNEYIFLCKGDKVRWFTDKDKVTFTVQFDDTSAARPNRLFDSGQSTFPSKPDTSADKRHKQVTETQTIGPNATPYDDFSYKTLSPDKGQTVSNNDPHIIPM